MRIAGHDIEAAIFDFDGTLADSMWVWDEVDRAFLAKRGIPFTDDYGEMIAVLGFESGADYTIEHFGLDENADDIIAEWKELAEESYATKVLLKPGARAYLEMCREQGLPLAIATSLQRHLLEPALVNNGIFDYFETICVCDELCCGGKASPAVYLEAMRRLDVDGSSCAVFEDVVTAACSAKQTGAAVVGIYDVHKQQATEQLKEVVDVFITSWEELL